MWFQYKFFPILWVSLKASLGVFLLLSVLLGLIIRLMVDFPDIWKSILEDEIESALGAPVVIHSVDGRFNGLKPNLTFREIYLENDPNVRVGNVHIEIDVVESLFKQIPIFTHLRIEHASVILQENKKGYWKFKGLYLAGLKSEGKQDVPLFERINVLGKKARIFFQSQYFWSLENSRFLFRRASGEELVLDLSLRLDSSEHQKHITSQAFYEGQEIWSIDQILSSKNNQWEAQEVSGKASFNLKPLASLVSQVSLSSDVSLQQFYVTGHARFNWTEETRLTALVDLSDGELVWKQANQQHHIKGIHGNFYRISLDGVASEPEFGINKLGFQLNDEEHELPEILLSRGEVNCPEKTDSTSGQSHFLGDALRPLGAEILTSCWKLQTQKLDLEAVTQFIAKLDFFPIKGKEILRALRPQGTFKNLSLQIPEANPAEWVFAAEAERLGLNAWGDVPSFSGVSGYLSMKKESGFFDAMASNAKVHVSNLFSHEWNVHTLVGRTNWKLLEDRVVVWSDHMETELEENEKAKARFSVLVSPVLEDEMVLFVQGKHLRHDLPGRFLPDLSPGFSKEITKLLQQDLSSGNIEEVSFFLMNNFSSPSYVDINFKGKFTGVDFSFDPNWPELKQGDGAVTMGDHSLEFAIDSAELGPVSLASGKAFYPLPSPLEKVKSVDSNLGIDIGLSGRYEKIWPWVFSTPLGGLIPSALQDWKLKGEANAKLLASFALEEQEVKTYKLEADFRNTSLRITEDIEVNQVVGQLGLSDTHGIFSDQLKGEAFSLPVTSRVSTDVNQGVWDVGIKGEATFLPSHLEQHYQNQFFSNFEGNSPVSFAIDVSTDTSKPTVISMFSDFDQTEIHLPPPFKKGRQVPADMHFRLELDKQAELDVRASDVWDMSLKLDDQYRPISGKLFIGDVEEIAVQNLMGDFEGVNVEIQLEEVDISRWWAIYQNAQSITAPAHSQRSPLMVGKFRFTSKIEHLVFDNKDYGAFKAVAWGKADNFAAEVENQHLSGRVDFHDGLLDSEIDWLRLPLQEQEGKDSVDEDWLGQIPIDSLPILQIQINEISFGEQEYGAMRFHGQLDKDHSVFKFTEYEWEVPGFKLVGKGDWLQSKETKENTVNTEAVISVSDSQQGLRLLSLPSGLDAKEGKIKLKLDWLGSPLAFRPTNTRGEIQFALEDGFIDIGNPNMNLFSLVSVINVDSLYRRMQLNFDDLLGDRIAFDQLYGRVGLEPGMIHLIEDGVRLHGPALDFKVTGDIFYEQDNLDLKIGMTFPLGNTAAVALLFVNPIFAGAVFVTDKVINGVVSELASITYSVKGSASDPDVSFHKVLDNE